MTTRPGALVAFNIAVESVNNSVRADPGVFPRKITDNSAVFGGTLTFAAEPPPPTSTTPGVVSYGLSAGMDFYEHMHVLPRSFDFGFILTTQLVPVEVFNGYRHDDHFWNAFVNNAGLGVSLIGMPILPARVFAMGGILMDLQVTTNGQPFVDTTLDFVFDVGTIEVPIVIRRVVLLSSRPENGYDELLDFGTDNIGGGHKDGTEQRASFRKNPRQSFEIEVFLEESLEDQRTKFENFLFDWQSQVFGVPVWFEEESLTIAAAPGATTLFVQSTAFADFRVGGLLAVLDELSGAFDVVPITVVGPTSIDLENGVVNAYPVGASVMPLRASRAKPIIQGQRLLNEVSRIKMVFEVIDNDVSIASLAAFPSFGGKLLLNGFIFADGSAGESFERQITVLDPGTGLVYQDSEWDRHKRGSFWETLVRGKQALWEHRQMLHAIRGSQTSFWLPTQRFDLRPILSLAMGSATIDIANVGYTQFVRNRVPRSTIRLTFTNGDPQLLRTVLASVEVDETRETLTLDTAWPANYTTAEIRRVEFVEKLRFDTDTIRINHGSAGGRVARISAPVKAVFS